MIFEIILLILAVPVGFLIAWLAKDELLQGRKWFKMLLGSSLLLALLFLISGQAVAALTCSFIAIVSFISIVYESR